MQGTVTAMKPLSRKVETVTITPEKAVAMLEMNTLNRPLNQNHVAVIAQEIRMGRWKFNGDTIKISSDNEVLDGQHRLWACIEAKKPIETVVVHNVPRDAFATIDTIRKTRSGSDTLAVAGATRYRKSLSYALMWYLRWERGILPEYRAPLNKIQNSDIEAAYFANPNMLHAVERCAELRLLCNPAVLGFIYYIVANRSPELAERMLRVLEDPTGASINDPFFRFRSYLTAHDKTRQRDSLMTIALAIKAVNAAAEGSKLSHLTWRVAGSNPEAFPKLKVNKKAA